MSSNKRHSATSLRNDAYSKASIAIKLRGVTVNPLSLDERKGLVGWFGNLKLGELSA